MTALTTFDRDEPVVRYRRSPSRYSVDALKRGLRTAGMLVLLAWGAALMVGALHLLGS